MEEKQTISADALEVLSLATNESKLSSAGSLETIKIKIRLESDKKTPKKTKPAVKKPVAKKTAVEKPVIKKAAVKIPVKKEKAVAVKKPKIAIVSLTSCEGCQFALLDLGEKFIGAMSQVEMVDFRLLEDEEDAGEPLEIGFVEGNPMTAANKKTLLNLRKRSKLLVVIGNCAAMGGIPEIKNYKEQKQTIKHVYKYIQGIENEEIQEVDNFVKVDFTLPGCPITGEEFLVYFPMLLESATTGKSLPEIADKPVCVECRAKGNRCLLLDKKPCFGPMILGGCDAVCPSSRMMCQGCRGLRPTGNVTAMRATLKTMMTDEEFENTTEIYGLRDDISEWESKHTN
jgi:sulfhydrogenase subunit delta